MCDYFDYRAASYNVENDERGYRVLPPTDAVDLQNPHFEVTPYYWVPENEVSRRLPQGAKTPYLIGFKDISTPITERSFVPVLLPKCGVGNSMPLIFTSSSMTKDRVAALVANLSSITLDYVARQKMGRLHFNYFIVKQFPVLGPDFYDANAVRFISTRVLELTYTAYDLAPFARDLGYDGPPFAWDEDRRACLRADLDAFYARAYGLTRDELRYILDPADVMGPEYPSETFRVLKENEMKRYGEYRTRRLVLDAWDRNREPQRGITIDHIVGSHNVGPARTKAQGKCQTTDRARQSITAPGGSRCSPTIAASRSPRGATNWAPFFWPRLEPEVHLYPLGWRGHFAMKVPSSVSLEMRKDAGSGAHYSVDDSGLVVFGASGPDADKAIRRAAALIRALPDTPLTTYREKTERCPRAQRRNASSSSALGGHFSRVP